MCILMRSLREVVPGQRRHPLTHLLLNQQHLQLQETQLSWYHFILFFLPTVLQSVFWLLWQTEILQPTSVALPWLRACSVKLQLLWMCSFPWSRDESWACRTCTQLNRKTGGARKSERKQRNGEWRNQNHSVRKLMCWQECERYGRPSW